jgi:hypothetical protein
MQGQTVTTYSLDALIVEREMSKNRLREITLMAEVERGHVVLVGIVDGE